MHKCHSFDILYSTINNNRQIQNSFLKLYFDFCNASTMRLIGTILKYVIPTNPKNENESPCFYATLNPNPNTTVKSWGNFKHDCRGG